MENVISLRMVIDNSQVSSSMNVSKDDLKEIQNQVQQTTIGYKEEQNQIQQTTNAYKESVPAINENSFATEAHGKEVSKLTQFYRAERSEHRQRNFLFREGRDAIMMMTFSMSSLMSANDGASESEKKVTKSLMEGMMALQATDFAIKGVAMAFGATASGGLTLAISAVIGALIVAKGLFGENTEEIKKQKEVIDGLKTSYEKMTRSMLESEITKNQNELNTLNEKEKTKHVETIQGTGSGSLSAPSVFVGGLSDDETKRKTTLQDLIKTANELVIKTGDKLNLEKNVSLNQERLNGLQTATLSNYKDIIDKYKLGNLTLDQQKEKVKEILTNWTNLGKNPKSYRDDFNDKFDDASFTAYQNAQNLKTDFTKTYYEGLKFQASDYFDWQTEEWAREAKTQYAAMQGDADGQAKVYEYLNARIKKLIDERDDYLRDKVTSPELRGMSAEQYWNSTQTATPKTSNEVLADNGLRNRGNRARDAKDYEKDVKDIDKLWQKVGQTIQNSLAHGLTAAIFQTEKLSDILKNILEQIAEMAIELGLKSLFSLVTGGTSGVVGQLAGGSDSGLSSLSNMSSSSGTLNHIIKVQLSGQVTQKGQDLRYSLNKANTINTKYR